LKAKLTVVALVALMLLALPGTASATFSAYTWKKHLLAYVNTYRSNHGLKRLVFVPRLNTAAQAHSNNMARYHLFSHYSSNGTLWSRRIRWYGYRGPYLGENLAVGTITAYQAWRMWVNSAPHRANLLRGVYDHIGVGISRGTYGGRLAFYVTADFGGY
jgi:uncharacterized protein YkwD